MRAKASKMVKPRIPELEDCGCGVSLAFGSKTIACGFLILSGAGFLFALYMVISEELDFGRPDEDKTPNKYIEAVSVMGMIVTAIYGSLTGMLYLGVSQHNPGLVLPWAILTTAFNIILTFIGLLLLLHTFEFSVIIVWLIIVTLYYCCLVVYSHFRELRREQNLPQSLSNSDGA